MNSFLDFLEVARNESPDACFTFVFYFFKTWFCLLVQSKSIAELENLSTKWYIASRMIRTYQEVPENLTTNWYYLNECSEETQKVNDSKTL